MIRINLKKKKPGIIVRFLEDIIQGIEGQRDMQKDILNYPPGAYMYPSKKIKYPDMDHAAEFKILVCEFKLEILKALRSAFGGKPIERRKT